MVFPSLMRRLASAAIAAGVVLFITLNFGFWGALCLCLAVGVGVNFEISRILFTSAIDAARGVRMSFQLLGFALLLVAAFAPAHLLVAFVCSAILLSSVVLFRTRHPEQLEHSLQLVAQVWMGLGYAGLCGAAVIALLHLDRGANLFICLLFVVFIGDSFAYFAGRALGQRKLAPIISPQKTVAGAVGGLVGSCLAMAVAAPWAFPQGSQIILVFCAIPVAIFAQAGDIFESALKRVAKVKDSGHVMPGHGGLLDRVDGVYFAAPVFYLLASQIGTML